MKFNKKAISDFVIEDIIEKIKSEQFAPGERLPSEKSLSEEFDISRASTREALQKLEVLGLIDIKHGKGSFVSDSPYLKPIQEIVASKLLTVDVGVKELLETRLYIEQGTVKLASINVSESELNELEKVVGEMDKAVEGNDVESFSELDLKFHLLVGRISGNTLMRRMLRTIRDIMREQQERINRVDGVMSVSQEHHEKILEAIENKDVESAQRSMADHLVTIKQKYEQLG
jgi:GntR family transcriptional repressor for pyruvate dehydrogenase complex